MGKHLGWEKPPRRLLMSAQTGGLSQAWKDIGQLPDKEKVQLASRCAGEPKGLRTRKLPLLSPALPARSAVHLEDIKMAFGEAKQRPTALEMGSNRRGWERSATKGWALMTRKSLSGTFSRT